MTLPFSVCHTASALLLVGVRLHPDYFGIPCGRFPPLQAGHTESPSALEILEYLPLAYQAALSEPVYARPLLPSVAHPSYPTGFLHTDV